MIQIHKNDLPKGVLLITITCTVCQPTESIKCIYMDSV